MSKQWWNFEVSAWWARALVGRRPAVTLLRMVVLLGLYFLVFKVLLLPIRVTGASMSPTYRDGRVNFINRMSYLQASPERLDVVAIRKTGTLSVVIKRIVALPGERVAVRRGRVRVNGLSLPEPYVEGNQIPSRPEVLLRRDEYFAIGDNRDITACEVVRRDEILGKALF